MAGHDQCPLCGNLRTYEDREQAEIDAMLSDLVQTLQRLAVRVDQGQARQWIAVDLRIIVKDTMSLRERIQFSGQREFWPDVPI